MVATLRGEHSDTESEDASEEEPPAAHMLITDDSDEEEADDGFTHCAFSAFCMLDGYSDQPCCIDTVCSEIPTWTDVVHTAADKNDASLDASADECPLENCTDLSPGVEAICSAGPLCAGALCNKMEETTLPNKRIRLLYMLLIVALTSH